MYVFYINYVYIMVRNSASFTVGEKQGFRMLCYSLKHCNALLKLLVDFLSVERNVCES